MKEQLQIAVIGDVHDRWSAADNEALEALAVDLALFVGDFGNESVDIVRTIAELNVPKAAILGNHDAWYTASPWGRKRAPYNREAEDRVQQQLDLLGTDHVGYGKLDFPEYNLSVVGGRPFSWGGSDWKNSDFYRDRFGVESFEESAAKIAAVAQSTLCDNLIIVGHNGPLGLGEKPEDICGKDWGELWGDHGDPDLRDAIAKIISYGKSISFVTFGHMHHSLRHRGDRLRTTAKIGKDNVLYLNAASVPRVKTIEGVKARNLTLVTMQDSSVTEANLVWLDSDCQTISQTELYQKSSSSE